MVVSGWFLVVSLSVVGCCRKGGKPPNFFKKAAIGMTAGGIGAFVGTPAEVALIRMTSDGRCVAT